VSNDASQVSALNLANRAMIAFARPTAPEDQWWSDLSPMLSDTARSAYTGTDPASVPASNVTGRGELLPSESGYLATARVPTDAGVYTILLSRDGQNAPWAVERLTPPASN
jgi:hypothetical protein